MQTNDNDDKLLAAMGLHPERMDQSRKQDALRSILTVLNDRVMERVASTLGQPQLEEFEAMLARDADEKEVADWLGSNVPDYNQIIEEEAQAMKTEHDHIIERSKKK